MHALKHTHASKPIKANQNIKLVSVRLGHANSSITLNTYTHLFKDDPGRDKIEIANRKKMLWEIYSNERNVENLVNRIFN